jgi:hypothetical protein
MENISRLRAELIEDTKIDKFDLHEMVATQPSLYMKWADRLNTASELKDQMEKILETCIARMDLSIRRNPEEFQLPVDSKGNPKETAIQSVIALDKSVIEAKNNLFEAKKMHSFLKTAVKSMDQRKQMIKEEGELWRGEYYSDIKVMDKESKTDTFRNKMGEISRRRKQK